jgi:alcohol dehydrogenase class IV
VTALEIGGRVPVVFGAGRVTGIADDVTALANPRSDVLVVADAGLRPLRLIDRVVEALREGDHNTVVYDAIAGEPKERQVEEALALGRGEWVHAVVALGGGSALDAAKMVALFMREECSDVTDWRLAAKPLPTGGVPVVCIPTTAGTGSEMTPISVLSADDGTKFWYWGEPLYAQLALLDPELSLGLPPRFTAMTGMDALVHAVEAATNRNAGPESEAAAHRAIRLVAENLVRAVREPGDIGARGAMLQAAALAGVAIDRAGTALAHNIGHALGSLAPVPHGLAVTLAMAATAEWVVEGNREGFARVAEAMGCSADADAFPGAFRRIAAEAGLVLDTTAAAPGLAAEALAARMAAPENASMRKSTKRQVRDEDLLPLAEMTVGLGRGENLLPRGEGGRGVAG